MKKVALLCMTIVTTLSASAQLFSPESLNGAFLGSLIGGIAGGDCRHGFSGNGAAIGAGVGFLAGAVAGETRRNHYYDSPDYFHAPATTVSLGYGYGHCGSSGYVYYSPNYYCAPNYYYRPATTRPNYAVGGTLLGAASGALIGQGAKGKPGEGAAIGAAAGLVLGSIAEHSARRQEQRIASTQATATQPQVEQPAPAVVVQNPSITSKPCATSTYTWTPRPQIADAPRVPDAPTF